jgi:3-methyladenine DNA glycosylase AlkD
MNVNSLHKKIVDYCRKNRNEATVKKYAKYFKEGYDAYGLSQEQMDEITRSVLDSKNVNPKKVLELSNLLVKSWKYEETFLAIRIVKSFSEEFDLNTFNEVNKWFNTGIVNWAHTDVLCGTLMTLFIEKKIISLNNLKLWRTASNKYQRRAVPVTMLHYLKKSKNDYRKLFEFIEPLMLDEERVVQQGLGWFLREARKNKKNETERFLMKWKDKAPRLIYQYAAEKMTPAEKSKFKRRKS